MVDRTRANQIQEIQSGSVFGGPARALSDARLRAATRRWERRFGRPGGNVSTDAECYCKHRQHPSHQCRLSRQLNEVRCTIAAGDPRRHAEPATTAAYSRFGRRCSTVHDAVAPMRPKADATVVLELQALDAWIAGGAAAAHEVCMNLQPAG